MAADMLALLTGQPLEQFQQQQAEYVHKKPDNSASDAGAQDEMFMVRTR